MDSRLRAFIRERLGVQPRDERYYETALTGWSITGAPEQSQVDKQEFLGDAVLGLAISELLMHYHPNESVGVLSASKATLVSGKMLARKSQRLGLPEVLKSLGVPLPARMQDVLADVMESLIGAVYVDLGFAVARSLIDRLYRDDFPSVVLGWEQRDLKGVLQEILVRETGEMPDYHTRPADGKAFHSEVFAMGRLVGQGHGGTKKEAEVRAAENALLSLNEWLKELLAEKAPPKSRKQPASAPEAALPSETSTIDTPESEPAAAEPVPGAEEAKGPPPTDASLKSRQQRSRRTGRRAPARRRRKRESPVRPPTEEQANLSSPGSTATPE